MNLKWNRGQQDTNEAAFFAYNHTPYNSGRNWRGRTRGRGNNRLDRSGHSVICTYCHKANHLYEECRVRRRDERQRGATNALTSSNSTPNTKHDQACISDSACFISHSAQDWFADSGATQHISDQLSFFKKLIPVKPNSWSVSGIGGSRLEVRGFGGIDFVTLVDGVRRRAYIDTVLYVPDLGMNLLSIAAITEVGVSVHFVESKVSFNRNDNVVMVGERIGRTLYHLAVTVVDSPHEMSCFATPSPPSIDVWHQRLAHTSIKRIQKMAAMQLVDELSIITGSTTTKKICEGCLSGKMERLPFETGRTRATQVGQLIHSDLCGPMHVETPRGSRYFVLFTDDCSSYRTAYLVKHKSDVAERFQEYINLLRSETGQKISTLRTDNGGEFTGNAFKSWLAANGIRLETSVPHTPEQNGVAERANRTIMEAARSLVHAKRLQLELWGEAVMCAVYTLNRVTTSTEPNTPFQTWYGSRPDISNLRIFGSVAHIHVPRA